MTSSMPPPSGTTVVFDLGRCACRRPGSSAGSPPTLGVPEADAGRAYWAHRARHDRGGPLMRYWTAVFTDLGLPPDRDMGLGALVGAAARVRADDR